MKNSKPSTPNFELAVNSLIDTNYRTFLTKYMVSEYLLSILENRKP
jgi:hypothetical protein